jgi:hypothetical protein
MLQDLTVILDKYLPKPLRRRGTATLTDAASFIAHLKRFAESGQSAVFANPDRAKPSLTASSTITPRGDVTRRTTSRTARLRAGALRRVAGVDRQERVSMSQADFAAFIEDRLTDVIVPNLDDPTIKTFARLVQGRSRSRAICSRSRAASRSTSRRR